MARRVLTTSHLPGAVIALGLLMVVALSSASAATHASVRVRQRTDVPGDAADTAPTAAGRAHSAAIVQNLDPTGAVLPVGNFYRQGSGDRYVAALPAPVPPGAVAVFGAQAPTGVHSLVVQAEHEIGTVTHTHWAESGRTYQEYGVAYQNAARPGLDVLVPFVARRWQGWTSFVTVQNTDAARGINARLEVYSTDVGGLLLTVVIDLPPGASRILGLAQDRVFDTVPDGFRGRMRVRSATPVAVASFLYVDGPRRNVAAFDGLGEDSWGRELYAPLVETTWSRSTLVAVMSADAPGSGSATTVRVTYRGHAGACAGRTFTHGPVALPAGAGAVFAQGPEGTRLPTGPSGLPADCIASAVVESDRALLAGVVIDVRRDGGPEVWEAGASTTFTAQDGARDVFVPVFEKYPTLARSYTSMYAMNIGPVATTATVTFYESGGEAIDCGARCTTYLEPYKMDAWEPINIAAIPSGSWGSAMVRADEPLVVVVVWRSRTGSDEGIFNALPRRVTVSDPSTVHRTYVPVFNQETGIDGLPVPPLSVVLPVALRGGGFE